MTDASFDNASWIARPVPTAQRISRSVDRDRQEWAAPGEVLAQTFLAPGAVHAINLDVIGPRDVEDPFRADVRFVIALRSVDGATITEKIVEGPQLLWERFGQLLDVTPPAPAGEYVVELRPERETIGWYAADESTPAPDDGVSPTPIIGWATLDGSPLSGTLLIAIETDPAPNPQFRTAFSLDEEPAAAILSSAVLGAGVVFINGHRVGDEAIGPAVTDYDHTVLYRDEDVAHLLRAGRNEILVLAGRERYAARGGDIWGWSLAPWHSEPTALVQLRIEDSAGATTMVTTGPDWETAVGPVERELLFGGEDWVVRSAQPVWEPVAVVAGPAGQLRRAEHPPIRALAPLPPVTTEPIGGGSATVYDFGRVMTGRIRCVITGEPGSSIRVTAGEQRDAAGHVVCDNTLAVGDAQVDTIRLERALTGETWEPQFGYRGFRWLEVETLGEVSAEQVRAVPLYTPLEQIGQLSTSEPLLEWIDTALGRTFRNNLHGLPTDTPIYEKNGWTADAHLATEALLHHFDLQLSFRKWMDDHADAQAADGAIPHIVPTPGWGRASDPAWSSSAVLIPWYLYREYGDRDALSRSLPMIRRYADNLIARCDGGLWPDRSWGDWLAPGYGVGPEGMAPIGTIMVVTALDHTARILRELGAHKYAEHYASESRRAAAAYHEAYFDAAVGHYRVDGVGYRQSLNVLPLAFDAVPEERVASVRRSLIDDIENRTSGHLDCGAVATRHLLQVLSEAGRDDLALTVLLQCTRPGWGAWFEEGESTLLEAWDIDARSRNHYFLGSVASWIQQRVGALRATEPGWTAFEIAPVDDPRVDGASMTHLTPRGRVASTWERGPGGWHFRVDVPEGSRATVRVAGTSANLGPGHHDVRITSTGTVRAG